MHKIFKRYPNQVKFLYDKNAIVYTAANGTLNELSEQRKRWVSKSTKYESRYITLVLLMAYFYNLSMLINLFVNTDLALLQLAFKILIEGMFLATILTFFNSLKLILLLPVAEFFHILYVVIIGILANFGSFKWKGRIHHH
jgi:antibiotic biosynthesis monooxygenase (ABM) superfamily enzyme